MRLRLLIGPFLLLATAALAQPQRPAPWRAALRDAPLMIEAGEELLALCHAEGAQGLASRFAEGRVRLFMRQPEIPDGLYGRSQARALLRLWAADLEGAEPALALASPGKDGRSARFLLEWKGAGTGASLVCSLELAGGDWRLREVQAP